MDICFLRGEMMKKIMILAVMLLVLLVPQAFAFELFGLDWSFKGIKKINQTDVIALEDTPTPLKTTTMEKIERREQAKLQEQLVDIDEALELANSDPWVHDMFGSFEDDTFCVESDQREVYAQVQDSVIVQLEEKPDDCYRVEVTEAYAQELMQKYKDKEYVPFNEVMDNVKTSFMLKAKVTKYMVKDKILGD